MAPRPGGGRLRLAGLLPAGCHTSFPGQQGRFLEKLLCCSGTSCEGDPWALLRQLGNLRGGRAKPGACGRSFLFLFLSGLWSVKWEGGGPGAGEASEPPSVGTRCPSAAAAPGGGLWGPARSDPTLASPPPPHRGPRLCLPLLGQGLSIPLGTLPLTSFPGAPGRYTGSPSGAGSGAQMRVGPSARRGGTGSGVVFIPSSLISSLL